MEIVATVFAVVFVVRVTFLSSENLSVIITMNCSPVLVFGRGPRILIVANCNGVVGGNTHSLRCSIVVRRFLDHEWQSSTVAYKSLAVHSRENSRRMESYTRRLPRCPTMSS